METFEDYIEIFTVLVWKMQVIYPIKYKDCILGLNKNKVTDHINLNNNFPKFYCLCIQI